MFKSSCWLIFALLIASLTGCNGATSDSETVIQQTANSIEITLQSSNQIDRDSFPNVDTLTINARLLDTFREPMASKALTVSSTLGQVQTASILTNGQGIASTTLSGSELLGAGTVTVTYGSISAELSFEFTQPDTAIVAIPVLSISLQKDNISANRFKTVETVQLIAQLTDAHGVATVDYPVEFSVDKGSLSPSSALTDDAGMASVSLTATEQQLGAGKAVASVAINGQDYSATMNYQVLAGNSTNPESEIHLGYFDDQGSFIENKVKLSLSTISAGGTTGVSVVTVDGNEQFITTPTPVSFSSNCVASAQAEIDNLVFTVNGIARATFEDISCAGAFGTDDTIVATIAVNSATLTASNTLSIAKESLGSIEFVSASPQAIVLKGTGGQNTAESATLVFRVKSALGNPLANQEVTFSLDTTIGGLSLSPLTSLTNSAGLVSTKVASGNVPTVVRVIASTGSGDSEIKTQSDLLSINTGLADQNSMTLVAQTLNPEAFTIVGVEVPITVWLADAFNNPVPDGTTVNFTTEGGNIDPSCNTINGRCSVSWESSNPKPDNHRITILATALGHETFFDTNGNNVFDNADGNAIVNAAVNSGLGRLDYNNSGFVDMSEAWRDDNENSIYENGELFLDKNNNGALDSEDGKFNGPQCQGNNCSNNISIDIRKALVLVMSGSDARMTLTRVGFSSAKNNAFPQLLNQWVLDSTDAQVVPDQNSILVLNEEAAENFAVTYADFGLPFGQMLPKGTVISVSSDVGILTGATSVTIDNTIGSNDPDAYNGQSVSFTVQNSNTLATPDEIDLFGYVTVTATTPGGTKSSVSQQLQLIGN